jgi:hypothetical protein
MKNGSGERKTGPTAISGLVQLLLEETAERVCSQRRLFWRHVGDENSKTGWMIAPAALHHLLT